MRLARPPLSSVSSMTKTTVAYGVCKNSVNSESRVKLAASDISATPDQRLGQRYRLQPTNIAGKKNAPVIR
jgi:hypothetical protein